MLVAILPTLALSVIATSWRTQMRTYRTEVHEAGEGDDPEIFGVDYVATVELQWGATLDTCTGERIIEQRTNQKTIG